MLFKNVASQKVAVYAHDTSADEPKTGDAANITAYVSKDGAAAAQTNDVNPTELDATNMKGIYLFDLTQAESNCDLLVLSASSSTADIQLDPLIILTQAGAIPKALADGAGGLPISDAGGLDLDNNVQNQLAAINLDHLCKEPTAAADMTAEVADNTILSRIMSDGDTSEFTPSLDGLQLIRAEVTAILVDTGTTIPALLPAALVGGRMSSDAVAISGSTDAADRMKAAALGIVIGTVNSANTTPTTTLFACDDITEATADHFIGRLVLFYDSGDALFRQMTDITDYAWDATNSEAKFTVTALTEAPLNGAKIVIL